MAGSSTTTQWILELIDKVSAPMKGVDKSTSNVQKTVNRVTAALDDMDDATKATAKQAINSFNELQQELKQEERQVEKLKNHLKDLGQAVDPLLKAQIDFDINQAETKVRRYKEQLVEVQAELKEIENAPDKTKLSANWGAAVIVANQTVELVNKAIDGLSFTTEIEALRVNIERFSGTSGDQLDSLTAKAYKLGSVFKESPDEIAKAANAMTKQIGGSYEENFALIEAGFEKGANINGDFIDQLKEYPTFIEQLGLSQSQAIAMMAKAGQDGIFSDKAIDSIKEADLSLKEMGKPQIDALKGIGLEVKDLANKTTFEAVQMITKSMDGATTQAKQLVLADIFKGAGEDAGLAWIEGLGSIDLDINNIPSVKQAGSGIRGWLADVKTSFSETFGSIGASIVELSPVVTGIASMIPLMQSLSKVTWVQNAAQWALNIAMDANPIGLIILGVAALIGLVATVVKYYDDWGASLSLLMGPLGWIINVVQSFRRHWDSITDAFTNGGIVAGIKRIGLVLLDAILMPMEQLLSILSHIPGLGKLADGGKNMIAQLRSNLNLDENDEKETSDKKIADSGTTNFTNTLDGVVVDANGNKTNSGLNGIGKDAGKTVTMNLDIKNYFNIDGNWRNDIDKIADAVTGKINDRMRDSLISL